MLMNPTIRLDVSGGATETMVYRIAAAADEQSSEVLQINCADAYYMKGYALVDLGELNKAEVFVRKSLGLSPSNALYRSELGQILQSQGEWELALESFAQAEEDAKTFSPEPVKQAEFTRAKRGVGFNFFDFVRLDDAVKKFQDCLDINIDDAYARN